MIHLEILGSIFLLFAIVFGTANLLLRASMHMHQRRYPQDAELYRMAMQALTERPACFTASTGNQLVVQGLGYKITGDSLQANGKLVNLCLLQETRISRQAKKIWEQQGRIDPQKAEIITKLKAAR